MKYRARNISTNQAVYLDDQEPSLGDRATVAEWVLEFDMDTTDDVEGIHEPLWMASSFHRKDINGVTDPRPFSEILNALREISK